MTKLHIQVVNNDTFEAISIWGPCKPSAGLRSVIPQINHPDDLSRFIPLKFRPQTNSRYRRRAVTSAISICLLRRSRTLPCEALAEECICLARPMKHIPRQAPTRRTAAAARRSVVSRRRFVCTHRAGSPPLATRDSRGGAGGVSRKP